MKNGLRVFFLSLICVALYGCASSPAGHLVDTNAANARLSVIRDGQLLMEYRKPPFNVEDIDDDDIISIKAEGYETFEGRLSDLKPVGQNSWYKELRARSGH